ncbi:MAG: Omp28-related outer membrane protein [Rikenellaceae bacterium]
MKKLFFTLVCVLVPTMLFSCSESESVADKLLIEVSSSSVFIDDVVTFKVTLGDEDVTASSQIINVTDSNSELEVNEFSSLIAGLFTFKAIYNGAETENRAVLTVTRRDADPDYSREFLRRTVIFKGTATWCVYCPDMTDVLDVVSASMPDQIVEVAMHGTDDLSTTAASYYLSTFGITGLPTVVVDGNTDYSTSSRTVSLIKSYIVSSTDGNPTVSGLQISSSIDDDNQLTVDVDVAVTEKNTYKLVVAILVDGYNLTQSGATSTYTQNNVLHAKLQTTNGGDSLGELNADERVSKSYTYDFSAITSLPEGTSVRLVAFILNQDSDGSSYYVNNAVTCPLGGSTAFTYVEAEE